MRYSIIKWHSHYRIDGGPVLKALWIKQLSTTEKLNGPKNFERFKNIYLKTASETSKHLSNLR